jgi:nucleoside diphosphate kinase
LKEKKNRIFNITKIFPSNENFKKVSNFQLKENCMTASTVNIALVFIKPHANTPGVERLLLNNLEQRHISVVAQGLMTAEDIDKKGTIDKHYYSIARYATIWKPSEIPITADAEQKFQEAFNKSWKDSIEAKKVLNASEALQTVFHGSEAALATAWGAAKVAKLAPGFYAGYCEKEQIYLINGFFIAMRAKFTTRGGSVRWFVVQWNEIELSWSEFRGTVIGATNPEKAAVESVRAQILHKWQELQLPGKPNGSDNGIHASAGPLEGLNERIIWLNGTVAQDRFGRTLLDAGVDAGLIGELLSNPSIHVKGNNVPVFDVLEDKDSSYVVQFLVNYQLAHGTTLAPKNPKDNAASRSSAARNFGLLFIKPSQNTPDVQAFVHTKLKNAGIQIKATADVSCKKIAEENILQNQFASLHRYATSVRASEYNFDEHQKTLFRSTFSRDFDEANELALICNAKEAAERLNVFADEENENSNKKKSTNNTKSYTKQSCGNVGYDLLLAKWIGAVKQTFAPGLTIAYYSEEDLYVANGYYLAMEQEYTSDPSRSVRLYHLEWDESRLTWQEFLEVVIGNTDPLRARPGSLRAQLYAQWRSLGLQSPPDMLHNVVTASSSPIEALKDRLSWFGGTVGSDVFGRTCLACGVPEEALNNWLTNPVINIGGGRKGHVFSVVRGMDSSKVIRLLAGQPVSSVLSAAERQALLTYGERATQVARSGIANNNSSAGVAPALEEKSRSTKSPSRNPESSSSHGSSFSPAAKALLSPRRQATMRSSNQRDLLHSRNLIGQQHVSNKHTILNTRDGVDVAPPRPGNALSNTISPRRRQIAKNREIYGGDRELKLEAFRRHDLSTGDLSEEKLREYFRLFDKDGSGSIDRNEFKAEFRRFENFGLTPTPEEIDELFDRYDFVRDGYLSFDEFALLMCHRTQM